jgi:hypothetical protein
MHTLQPPPVTLVGNQQTPRPPAPPPHHPSALDWGKTRGFARLRYNFYPSGWFFKNIEQFLTIFSIFYQFIPVFNFFLSSERKK